MKKVTEKKEKKRKKKKIRVFVFSCTLLRLTDVCLIMSLKMISCQLRSAECCSRDRVKVMPSHPVFDPSTDLPVSASLHNLFVWVFFVFFRSNFDAEAKATTAVLSEKREEIPTY